MKAFDIFKTGKHTATSGATLEFNEELLQGAVIAYDPALHEAPIVVGHPKDNHPAFGWVKSLSFADGTIVAEPGEVDADFAEAVEAGRYKKRSASWYLPDSPNNPKPGTLYLRHVGFLGAMPPAIKGLRDVAFAEGEEGVVEFSETPSWVWRQVADLFRSIRESMIADKGVEVADKIIPTWSINTITEEATRIANQPPAWPATPSFNEQTTAEDATVSKELQDKIDALTAENATLKTQVESKTTDFSEKEQAIAARESALAKKEISAEVDALVAAGKVLPKQKAGLVEFMASLADSETTVEFGEGDQAKKLSPRAYMREYLSGLPKLVDFQEKSAPATTTATDLTNEQIADKAQAYKTKLEKEGRTISFTEAVAAVNAGTAE